MKIVSANISSLKNLNNLWKLPHVAGADVVCLQETTVAGVEKAAERLGYRVVAADRLVHPGGGGVAILSRIPIQEVTLDEEHGCLLPRGQYVSGIIDGIQISSVYVTHDSTSRQFTALSSLFASQVDRRAVIAGDMNIFRDGRDSWRFAKAIDNRNKGQVEYGCDETAMTWFRNQFKSGWVDVIGKHARERRVYTYWNTTGHYERGEGTRLDYILASPAMAIEVKPQSVVVSHEVRFGRHAQVSCVFDESLVIRDRLFEKTRRIRLW